MAIRSAEVSGGTWLEVALDVVDGNFGKVHFDVVVQF